MKRHFDQDMEQLNQLLRDQAERVAEAVRRASKALRMRDPVDAEAVESAEAVVDKADIRIEEECLKILALHQPVADQLRYVFSAAKVNYSLERIADLAVRIARTAKRLEAFHLVDVETSLTALTEGATRALLDALEAFVTSNATKARAVVGGDGAVDWLRDELLRRIDTELVKGGGAVHQLLRFRQTAQRLERIADHARHIAENVLYHVEGDMVRHRPPEDVGHKPVVLFLCTGNSARSQMAEALLRNMAGEEYEARSAGTEPRPIHPLTPVVMKEIGIALQGQFAKGVQTFLGHLAVHTVIVVCEHAVRNCPTTWPGVTEQVFWDIPDPAAVVGTEDEKLTAFRSARDLLAARIRQWLDEQKTRANIATEGHRAI
jgi:phosphate transport system regulatory protein PhoU